VGRIAYPAGSMTTPTTVPTIEKRDVGGRHPKGLYVLFATEMWERFGFYSTLSMLTLYLQNPVQGFGWTAAKATSLYSTYLGFVFASPLVGGWLADRLTGYPMAITVGGVLLSLGYFLLALPSLSMLYVALVCLVIGNGFFKPNVSAMVGNLYTEGSPLKDSAYNIFYMGINIGAFVAPVVAEIIMQRKGFHTAFAAAGAGMLISLIIFCGLRRQVIHLGEQILVKDIVRTAERGNNNSGSSAMETIPDSRRILALIMIFLITLVFWMVFFQSFSTLTYWANDNTDWEAAPVVLYLASILTLGTVKPDEGNVSGVISNAIDPFWIVVLTFPLVAFWRWLGRKAKEPSTPSKMAMGMLLAAVSFYIMYFAARNGGDYGKVSPWWLIGAYAVIALGELMLSPMGLSLVSKVSPSRTRGLMMGGWFVATAIGSKLTVIGVYWDVWKHSTFFFILATMALLMGGLLVILLKPLTRAMPGV
jgi:POT family proton-dependent oligopeptide transporter